MAKVLVFWLISGVSFRAFVSIGMEIGHLTEQLLEKNSSSDLPSVSRLSILYLS